MNIKHIIWTNEIDEEYERSCRENVAENTGKPVEDVTDDEILKYFNARADLCYDEERANLDQELDGRVLMIASLGLWNGRKCGYKLTDTRNLNGVLEGFCGDFVTVGSDGRNIVAKGTHHDGTNHYTFREVREYRNIGILLGKLYAGIATNADINRYTRSLEKRARRVYGW